MKGINIAAMVVTMLPLCSFILPVDKAIMPVNKWKYNKKEFQADSSVWSNRNSFQIDFLQLSDKTKPLSICISASFSKKPVKSGTYRVALFPKQDDELSILASDLDNVYMSEACEGCVAHVEVKEGKLHIWSDKVIMFEGPTPHVTTTFSFNLVER
jgi:hypothetical protein